MSKNEAGTTLIESVVPASFCVCDENSLKARLDSLEFNMEQTQNRVRYLEKLADTIDSPWWKIILFVVDGWPLRRLVDKPQWRPWRRWWTS